MGTAVQFYGFEEVMQAAKTRQCACWGIWIDGRLFSKYQDTDFDASMEILAQNLEVLEKSLTEGRYCLKFFETENNKPVKINERTVCDGGSFTFKMIKPEEREQRMIGYSSNSVNRALELKVAELEKKINGPEEEETIHTVVRDILKDPETLKEYLNIGAVLFGKPVQNFGSIGKINRATEETVSAEEKEKLVERLGTAVDKLEKHIPSEELVKLMEKMAAKADSDPEGFNKKIGLVDLL